MKYILQVEHALLGLLTVYIYFGYFHYSWWLFVGAFFIPDISMLGYLINTRIGANIYNIVHSLIAPCTLLTLAWLLNNDVIRAYSLILFTHIFMDRALGYGLKYEDSFKHTHLTASDQTL